MHHAPSMTVANSPYCDSWKCIIVVDIPSPLRAACAATITCTSLLLHRYRASFRDPAGTIAVIKFVSPHEIVYLEIVLVASPAVKTPVKTDAKAKKDAQNTPSVDKRYVYSSPKHGLYVLSLYHLYQLEQFTLSLILPIIPAGTQHLSCSRSAIQKRSSLRSSIGAMVMDICHQQMLSSLVECDGQGKVCSMTVHVSSTILRHKYI